MTALRDAEKTIGNLIDKQKTAYVGSADADGFPNVKAMFSPENARESGRFILRPTHRRFVRRNTVKIPRPAFISATSVFFAA